MNNAQLHIICSVFGTFIIVHMSFICAKASRGKDKIDPTLSFPHTLYLVLCLDLCNSAAPGGDYITLMNNTHALCFLL